MNEGHLNLKDVVYCEVCFFLDWRKAWKNGRAPMANVLPRYRKNPPAEELPSDPAKPEMRICQISDGKLVVPRDVRQCFLTCPIWGPEWRQFLQDFDRDWGVAIPSSSPQKPASTPTPEKTLAKQEVKETSEEFWAKHFKEDPKTVDALKSKFGDDITEMAGADQASSLILTPGPQLYIAAKDATCLQLSATVPLISHGAGTWLLGAKADKFKSENPNKGIPCSWSSDEVPVIVEEIAFACLKVERFPNQLSTR